MPPSRKVCGIPARPWPVSTETWPAARLRPLSPQAPAGAAQIKEQADEDTQAEPRDQC